MEIHEDEDINMKNKCAVCFSFANLKCSLCKQVVYCSKNHQKFHWKYHKKDCRKFDIERKEGVGCFLFANRDLTGDTVLLQESPLVVGPRQEAVCLGCLCPLDRSHKATCPQCFWPVCSPACPGLSSATSHLPECIILSKNTAPAQSHDLRYEAILPLRCLILQRISLRKWELLMSIESNYKHRLKDKESYKETDERIVKYLQNNYLNSLGNETFKELSSKLLHTICGIAEMNSLDITSGGAEVSAIYPTFYFMEHSCVPNTKYYLRDSDLRITVSTVNNINSGEHLTTMYANALYGTLQRQEQLLSSKQFKCTCARCKDPTELNTNFSTLKCVDNIGDQICDGYLLPVDSLDMKSDWRCNSCSVLLSSEHVKHLTESINDQINSALQNVTIGKLEGFLTNLEVILHKNHYHCYTIKHSLIQLYGRAKGFSMEELSDTQINHKIDICENLKEITSRLDPGNCRLSVYFGVIMYELYLSWREKWRRGQGDLLKAKKYLTQCVSTLQHEPNLSPGHNLLRIADSALLQLDKQTPS